MKDQSAVERSCRKQKQRFEQDCIASWVCFAFRLLLLLTFTYDVKGALLYEEADNR